MTCAVGPRAHPDGGVPTSNMGSVTVSARGCHALSCITAAVALALSTLALGLGPTSTAQAATVAEPTPNLSVRLSALSPTVLKKGADITVSGAVTNRNDFDWDNVQAYLVIPRSPFTSRAQVDDAKTNSSSYTGERVVEIDSFDNVGDLAPGKTLPFTVKVTYEQLGITGADGVYPVGIQILATGPDGLRSNNAVARATTFIPLLHDPPKAQIPTSVAWPFLMPTYRQADGTYADAQALIDAINPGGRLRNMLGLARSTPTDTGTVVIDPALLTAANDLARGRRIDAGIKLSDGDKLGAESFVNELAALARRDRCWVVPYDRPDLLALSRNEDLDAPLRDAVEAATSDALDKFDISCRTVSWPQADSATKEVAQEARGPGDQPLIVAESNLTGWDRRDGSLVKFGTAAGPVPLLVDDALDDSVPGEDSVVTLRQRIVSESALAVLQRAIDPKSSADAIAVVNPDWNPGTTWEEGLLGAAFDVPWVDAAGLDSLLTRPIGQFDGAIEVDKDVKSIGRPQLLAATDLDKTAGLVAAILLDDNAVQATASQDVAQGVSGRWRSTGSTGLASLRGARQRAAKPLSKITIEGPPRVTLSSDTGSFPLTITNGTDHRLRTGVRIDSSNRSLTIPNVEPVTIEADERRTLTVKVDVGGQSGASVTATLITDENRAFGKPAEFNVQSSAVGAVIWAGFAIAGLLVAVAVVRRIIKKRRSAASDG